MYPNSYRVERRETPGFWNHFWTQEERRDVKQNAVEDKTKIIEQRCKVMEIKNKIHINVVLDWKI